ncbi:peptide methionine sulfoxide reductase msrb [Dellaglioa algida DSM 15638]|uniref:peptide-methionine (R)-S-oxide reductase n=3 Tax=Dellaglioa TaxID=2767880 RepID=A0A0R1HH00_9LACO|nr:peptide methionine sulfoxide reductase msrb [Dellaglioa algida DSM 15638]
MAAFFCKQTNCVRHKKEYSKDISKQIGGFIMTKETEKELRERLSKQEFEVTQHAATEAPFTGKYDDFYKKGIYVDIVSGEALFSSAEKYDAGCGWPSFSKPIPGSKIAELADNSLPGHQRVEVRSGEANSHLGHVFPDGPQDQGGLRYCINSASLKFIAEKEMAAAGYKDYLNVL